MVGELALALPHHLAHRTMARHNGDEAVYLRASNRRRHVDARDGHAPLVVERDGMLASELAETFAVAEIEAALKRQPGERAIHRPRIEVAEREPLGEAPGDGALARARRPVDCDDHRLATDSRSSKKPGKLIPAASAPSTSTPSTDARPATAPSIASRWSPCARMRPPRRRCGTPLTSKP